jgi:putative ABC transport system permease protein
MALGARAIHVVTQVTRGMLVMVAIGALAGLAGGLAFARVVQGLLFEVRATDPSSLAAPILVLAAAAALAALAPATRAVRIDPAQTLRAE